LVKLALQLVNDGGKLAPFLDQAGYDMILSRGHDALRCQ
jgi:hypothetical protein